MADTYTRQDWAIGLVNDLGNVVVVDPAIINWVAAWTTFESAAGEKGFNLLKTIQTMPGSTPIPGNSAGVQIYQSFADGVHANRMVLQQKNFGALGHALKTNDKNALGMTGGILGTDVNLQLSQPASDISSEIKLWNGNGVYSAYDIAKKALSDQMPKILAEQFPGSATDVKVSNTVSDITGGLSGTTIAVRVGYGLLGGVLLVIGLILAIKQIAGINTGTLFKFAAM